MSEEPSAAVHRRSVTHDDLMQLYQSIKSADTIALFDAAEALAKDDIATACEKLAEARARYQQKHARSLARDPNLHPTTREQRKAESRRQKVQDVLGKLNTYHAVLERNVKIRRATPAPKADPLTLSRATATHQKVGVQQDVLNQFRSMMNDDGALEALRSVYDVQAIGSGADISANTLFVVRSKEKWHLLRSPLETQHADSISFFNLSTDKNVSVSKATLLAASKRAQAFRLRSKARENEIVLDESELNVLWAVVRDTKLLPNASEITMIKKNEFRRRQYDRTLKKMLLLQRSFNAAGRAKRNEFKRELAMLEQKKQSMSLREIEKRKLKIAQETRLIERAESHFIKVMNCLHALDARRS